MAALAHAHAGCAGTTAPAPADEGRRTAAAAAAASPARPGALDGLAVAVLVWVVVEPWALGVRAPVVELAAGLLVALPLLARRRVPAAAAATLAAAAAQVALGLGAPPLHAPAAAALLAGHALGRARAEQPLRGLLVAATAIAAAGLPAAAGAGGWTAVATPTHLTFAGVVLGGFALGCAPRRRALRAARLRAEVAALEHDLAAELRAAAAAERAALAQQLGSLVAGVSGRAAALDAACADRTAAQHALRTTEREARRASGELRRLLGVLAPQREQRRGAVGATDPGVAAPADAATIGVVAPPATGGAAARTGRAAALRLARLHAGPVRHLPVAVFAGIGAVEQLALPARRAAATMDAAGAVVAAPPYPVAVAVALAVATALPLLARHRAAALAVAAVGVLLVARMAAGDLSSLTWSQNAIGIGTAFVAGAYAATRRAALAGLAAATTATVACWALEQVPVSVFEWAYLAALLAGAWTAGRRMAPHIAPAARGTGELARLRERRATLATESARVERARVAREVHDLVGHGLSLMTLQAAVGAAKLEQDAEPVDAAVRRVRGLAEATERELAELLAQLRAGDASPPPSPGGAPGLAALAALVADARRHGQPVELHLADVRVPPAVADALVAVAREALTNARKHSGAAPVRVDVTAGGGDGGVRLEVVNGRGTPLLGPTSRRGLAGLRDRLAPLGAALEAGPTADGGWRLTSRWPA